jgi:type I restriction-modification system DNA methylase subunit
MNNITSLQNDIVSSLIAIGYPKNFILQDYQFSDFYVDSIPLIRKTSIVAFGREPFDYKSACISINLPKDINSQQPPTHLRALGAPHIFVIKNGYTERWNNDSQNVKRIEKIRTENLPTYIKDKRNYLEPNYIIRKKSDFEQPTAIQLDLFIDSGLVIALDHQASIRLDNVIRKLIADIENSYSTSTKEQPIDVEIIFKLIFVLLTAKLLSDRNIITEPQIDFSDYRTVLNGVSNFYNRKIITKILEMNKDIVQSAVNTISQTIPLNNLSIDTLTYIYENTFVSPESRKSFGIHSTPSYVADYILSKIPLINISKDKLNIFDPMCGHGIFLVAAMRKLKEILPMKWNGKRRHEYFIKHLQGVEIDNFALEVANMCLTLADFPESNGWDLRQGNVFKDNILENFAKGTNVLLGNPPFEYEKYLGREKPKPALLLNRVLPVLPRDSYIGIILPNAFLDSGDYRETRDLLLRHFSLLHITNLPANTFIYSSSETSIIIAKRGTYNKPIYYADVNRKQIKEFKYNSSKTWEITLEHDYFLNKQNLKVPVLNEVWNYLKDYDRLDKVADIKIGVQNEPSLVTPKTDYKVDEFKNSVPAIISPQKDFYQYVSNQKYYIPAEKKVRRRKAWNYNWSQTKIIIPTGRISVGPWKFAAVIDYKSRYATRNFFAVWPTKENISVETLSAILNSPLAAAFVYANSSGRSITKRVYKKIPIPPNLDVFSEKITSMVKDYIMALKQLNYEEAHLRILDIDASILELYNLPPKFEHNLLKIFYDMKRPVPFDFYKYYPKNYDSWIPLNMYISQKYGRATFNGFVKSFPQINNKETVKFLEDLK